MSVSDRVSAASGRTGRSRASRPSDAAFVVAAVQALVVTAAVALPLAGGLAGMDGLRGAGSALAFLAVLYGVSSVLHALAASHGRDIWALFTLGGLALRIVLYATLLLLLRDVQGLHGPSLGATAAFGIVVGQVFESRALLRVRKPQGANR